MLSGLLMFLAVIGTTGAQGARAQVRRPQTQTAGTTLGSSPRPGVRTSAPSRQALSQALEQATGLTPSQVLPQSLCPPPSRGRATCLARALVLRSNHRPVRPLLGARRPAQHVFSPAVDGAPATLPAPPSAGAQPPIPGTPAYLQQAYDLTALSQTAGSGDTIAIVDAYDDPTAEQDLAYYRATFGLPACTSTSPAGNPCFRKLNEGGASSPLPDPDSGWEGEISLDLDAVSAICPNCRIVLIEATSNSESHLIRAENTAAQLSGVKQTSNSWGGPKSVPFGSPFTYSGISVVASTGDDGYQDEPGTANYPAALPGVTAAGGTTLSDGSDQAGGRGFGESAWSLSNGAGASSGCNTQIRKPSYQHDTGCTGRSYADVSADANPATGLSVRYAGDWYEIGGTSLASPLIAAYYALLAGQTPTLDTTSPAWAYANSSVLNDPITGSVGACPSGYRYICVAGVGYDGPTGIGSISGAVVQGAPGIGGPSVAWGSASTYAKSVGTDSVTLTGGVYPNGLDTSYHWDYGTSTSYGSQTSDVDVGAGQAPVPMTTTIGNLTPGATYHYRLVASNSAGTVAGYDYAVTVTPATPPAPPSDPTEPTDPGTTGTPTNPITAFGPGSLAPPSISGTATEGQTLIANPGEWAGAPKSLRFQWKGCARAGYHCFDLAGARSSTYRLTHDDVGQSLAVVVTAYNDAGSATATSAYTAAVAAASTVAPATPAPRITALNLSARSFSATRGAALTVSLSSAATVQLVVSRRLSGRKLRGTCRPGARTGTACTKTITVRSLAFHGRSGRNSFALRFPGLARGRYSATVTAHGASGSTSRRLTITFTISR
jgi:hypothetical protein